MIWGYAGVFPGEFGVWTGDVHMNMLRFIAQQGFECAEIGMEEFKDEKRREQIANFLNEYGIKSVARLHLAYFEKDVDELRREANEQIKLIEQCSCLFDIPAVTTCVWDYHRFMREPSLAEQMDELAEVLTPVAQACHDMGKPLGIENHGDYYCSDLVALCQRVPHLEILLDTGNTFLIGEQPILAIECAAPFTMGTHFKDHYVRPDKGELKFVIDGAPLGESDVGLLKAYEILMEKAPDPDNLVMLWEMVPPKGMDGYECMRRSWDFVNSLRKGKSEWARGYIKLRY